MSLLENEKQKQGLEGPCILYVEKGGIDAIANFGNASAKVQDYQEKSYFGFEEFINGQNESRLTYRSNKFTRLQVIPRNRFLELLREYSDDNEVFNMIKDDYGFNSQELLLKFDMFCNACLNKQHSLRNCPLVHFIPDREKIMKSHLYLNIQIRKRHERVREKNFFQSRLD